MTTLRVRIDSIAAGGDGVGRHEGMVVFVPRTAPGDSVEVRAMKRNRLMRGTVRAILEPGPDRVEPPCVHYVRDGCGGCQVQHIAYAAQLAAKAGIIRDALTRIGRVAVDAPAVERSDREWRYRQKLTLALRPAATGWIAGLRRYDDPDAVFALQDCPITDEQVMAHWRSVLEQAALLPAAPELRAAVRLVPGGFTFWVEGGTSWRESDRFFAALPAMRELWWTPAGTGRRRLHHRSADAVAGASFVQVNPGVAARLGQWVLELAGRLRPATAIDAYAGTGDLAVALAERGTRVVAIEIDRDAAAVCAGRLPAGSRAVAGAVEGALAGALPADIVIVNPPRGGLDAAVADTLRAHPAAPARVIYVSCNPATLARDIRRMERFTVQSLRGFDMFPQTAHVETVCELAA